MNTNKEPKEPGDEKAEELDILNNRETQIPVVFNDGTERLLTLRRVGITNWDALSEAEFKNDNLECLRLFLGDAIEEFLDGSAKAFANWIGSLAPESQLELLEKGGELNGPLLERYRKIQRDRREKMEAQSGIDKEELGREFMDRIAPEVIAQLKDAGATPDPSASPESSTSSSEPDTEEASS